MNAPFSFAQRLRQLLNIKGITQSELSRKTGVSKSSISHYLKGDWEGKQNAVYAIAAAYDVSEAWLMGADVPMDKTIPSSVILSDEVEVSEIATVAAGFDKSPLSNFEYGRFSVPRLYLRGHSQDECFIIRVKGDSMYPLYIDGDRILSRRANALDYSGQIGLVQDGETATIKKVEFGSGWLRLVPINPNYAPRTIRGEDLADVRIIGVPLLLLRELEE